MKAIWVTVGSLIVSVAFMIPGVLAKTGGPSAKGDKAVLDTPSFETASSFSWFIGVALGGLLTCLTMRNNDSLRESVVATVVTEAENADKAAEAQD